MKPQRSVGSDVLKDQMIAGAILRGMTLGKGLYIAEIVRKGQVIERFDFPNLITTQGLNHKRGVVLLAATQITAWYLIPTSGTPTIAATDTYASHAGWTEVTNYDETTREVWTGATGATGVASNSAAPAEFTISSGGATIGGIGLVGGGSDPTVKNNTAGGGTLFSASAFSGGNRVLQESDILRITWQHTDANA